MGLSPVKTAIAVGCTFLFSLILDKTQENHSRRITRMCPYISFFFLYIVVKVFDHYVFHFKIST